MCPVQVENRIRDYTARGRGRGGLFQRHVPGPGGGTPQYARGPPPVGAPGRPGPSRARIPSFNDRQGDWPLPVSLWCSPADSDLQTWSMKVFEVFFMSSVMAGDRC